MDFDSLLNHYFGTADLSAVAPAQLEAGFEQLAVDFGLEQEPGRRFALWTLMYVLEIAPDPEDAFETEKERSAARMFAQIAEQS